MLNSGVFNRGTICAFGARDARGFAQRGDKKPLYAEATLFFRKTGEKPRFLP